MISKQTEQRWEEIGADDRDSGQLAPPTHGPNLSEIRAAYYRGYGEARTQGQIVADMEADRTAARQGYNPNR